jgi:phytanoyl-CoA hydroxylase
MMPQRMPEPSEESRDAEWKKTKSTLMSDYARDGFAIIRNVVDPALIQEASQHVDWLMRRYPSLRPEHLHHPLMEQDAFWVRLVTDERLLDIAECFLGPDVACFTAHYICKPARDGHPVYWHQDGAYWHLTPMDALTVWLAVDETTTQNGCLQMIRGSHRAELVPPERRVDTANMLYSATPQTLVDDWRHTSEVVDVCLRPGDVSIHHPRLIHCSGPNSSNGRRCGLDIGYISSATRIANEGLYLNPILVRGSRAPGINTYRAWPHVGDDSFVFNGAEDWNDRAQAVNAGLGVSHHAVRSPDPLASAQQMIRRLQAGTVKAGE